MVGLAPLYRGFRGRSVSFTEGISDPWPCVKHAAYVSRVVSTVLTFVSNHHIKCYMTI